MKVYKSPKPDLDLPKLDLLTLLFDSNWCHASENTKIHVEAANPANSITKAGARDLVRRIAYVLRHCYRIGAAGPGRDVVLTITSGNPFIPVFFYAIVAAGGVFNGASTSFRAAELVQQIKNGGATLLVCTPEYESLTKNAAEQCGISSNRVLILDSKTPRCWKLLASDSLDVLGQTEGKMLDWERITDQQTLEEITVCLLYSSGTTGLPKGVRLSHWSLVTSTICTMDVAVRFKERSRKVGQHFRFDTIAHLPMANIAGVGLFSINPFYMGGSTYWMEHYDFDSFIEYHRQYRPHYQFSVPPIWLRIAKSEKVTDHFDNLQVACTGSAPIGYATARQVRRKLGKGRAHITQTWGTTETSGVITALDWHIDDKSWSVGAPCPNVTLRILNDADEDVQNGEPGELLVGGPILAKGYHKNPDATRDAFVDGFYRTGDIGVLRSGLVHIVDRKKELIKYKGNQVAPAELEALLISHPEIADAAVVGIWNSSIESEVPRGFIVRSSSRMGALLTSQAVLDFVKANLADHKQLRGGVVFINEIPKSASGKILRKDLRHLATAPSRANL